VSGSLPFDGTTLRELRERVIRGKYRIPFYCKSFELLIACFSNQCLTFLVSTDCEALLKKFLALNPTKRYTLDQIMKDKWMNQNEEELKPFSEPSVEMNDAKIMESLIRLGYKLSDIEQSLAKRRFDEIFASYLLIQSGIKKPSSNSSSRSKPDSLTSITSAISPSASANKGVPSSSSSMAASAAAAQKSETTTNGEGLKETSFMAMPDDLKTAAAKLKEPPSPEALVPANFKRQHTIGPESLKERNAIRLNAVSGVSRPISATPKVSTERSLQKSPVKPLRAFKPETSLTNNTINGNSSTTAALTPRRPNVNVYKKVDNVKDTPLLAPSSTANANSSSSSSAFARNGPSRYTFHSGQSRMTTREHNTLGCNTEAPVHFRNKGNFLQRLTTRFSKRFRLSQQTKPPTTEATTTASKN